jgi:hypothetical protein
VRKEFLLFLWTSELGVAWRSCLNALPALRSHATPINPLRDLVFSLGFLNTLAAVGLELADPHDLALPSIACHSPPEEARPPARFIKPPF